jgi:hypothetical protein
LIELEKDQLGRAAFARFVAKRIEADRPEAGAYSIHIYGPWGSGKTTLLNFMRRVLVQEKEWSVVEFNAWRNQHIRPPWRSLLESVFRQTKRQLNICQRFCEYLWRFNTGRIHYLIGIAVLTWIIALIIFPVLCAKPEIFPTLSEWAKVADNLSKIVATMGYYHNF